MNANMDVRPVTATERMISLFASYNINLHIWRKIGILNCGSAAETKRPSYGTKSATIALQDTKGPAKSMQLNRRSWCADRAPTVLVKHILQGDLLRFPAILFPYHPGQRNITTIGTKATNLNRTVYALQLRDSLCAPNKIHNTY